jgi:hypothetical protein
LASPMRSTRFIGEQHTLTPTRSKVKKNQMFLLQSPQVSFKKLLCIVHYIAYYD